jgi:hypothetical protein
MERSERATPIHRRRILRLVSLGGRVGSTVRVADKPDQLQRPHGGMRLGEGVLARLQLQ